MDNWKNVHFFQMVKKYKWCTRRQM